MRSKKLKALGDPNAQLDLTKPPQPEGHASDGTHTTKVHVDQEEQPPHAGGRTDNAHARTPEQRFRDGIGNTHYETLKAEVPALRAAHPEAAALTDDEIIALRGYVGDVRKPEFGGGRDFERINRALRDEDHQQLEILKEYIDQLKSGLSKMPQHKGRVSRMLPNEDEAFVRKEFVEGKTWTDRGFMSTSEGEALDKSWVMISFSDTKSGRKVGALQVFSEREVVFPPGVKFEVQRVIELPPGASSRFLIFLREL